MRDWTALERALTAQKGKVNHVVNVLLVRLVSIWCPFPTGVLDNELILTSSRRRRRRPQPTLPVNLADDRNGEVSLIALVACHVRSGQGYTEALTASAEMSGCQGRRWVLCLSGAVVWPVCPPRVCARLRVMRLSRAVAW